MDNQNKYEDKIDTFFDNLDKKKERSEKVRRIIKFVMRLIFPFFLLPFMMLFGVVVSLMLPRNNIGGIGVSIALVFLLFFPLYSIIYYTPFFQLVKAKCLTTANKSCATKISRKAYTKSLDGDCCSSQ